MAEAFQKPKTTIEKYIGLEGFKDKPRIGRPSIYSDVDIKNLQKENRESSTRELSNIWNKSGEKPGHSTINYRLKKLHVKTHKEHVKHQLTEMEKKLRVEISREHLGKTKKRHVIWFDETCSNKQYSNLNYHYFDGEDYKDFNLLHGLSLSGHFCGAISYRGKSELVFYKKKMNSTQYQKVIDNTIIDYADQLYKWDNRSDSRGWSLYQDGDKAHQSKSSLEYFKAKGIKLWERCPWSPDMACIEYIWSIFWIRVSKMKPKTNEELEICGKKAWKSITLKEIQNIIDNLDNIYKSIINSKGEYYRHTFPKSK